MQNEKSPTSVLLNSDLLYNKQALVINKLISSCGKKKSQLSFAKEISYKLG